MTRYVHDLATPALLIDVDALDHNLATMAAARPGATLRPHVKAHKCTALAAAQVAVGPPRFTCATPREVVGMADAGVGDDLLLANETLDPDRLAAWRPARMARITVAVDSPETIDAAAAAGISDVLIDVDIGLPRCGCPPDEAGRLADLARGRGLNVRGTMGYEGHLMIVEDRDAQRLKVERAIEILLAAHAGRRRDRLVRGHRHVRPPPPDERGPGRQLRADGHRLCPAAPAVPPGVHGARHGDPRRPRGPSPTSG